MSSRRGLNLPLARNRAQDERRRPCSGPRTVRPTGALCGKPGGPLNRVGSGVGPAPAAAMGRVATPWTTTAAGTTPATTSSGNAPRVCGQSRDAPTAGPWPLASVDVGIGAFKEVETSGRGNPHLAFARRPDYHPPRVDLLLPSTVLHLPRTLAFRLLSPSRSCVSSRPSSSRVLCPPLCHLPYRVILSFSGISSLSLLQSPAPASRPSIVD